MAFCLGNKQIFATPAGLQIPGEMPHISAVHVVFCVPSPPVLFNETVTIDRDSWPLSSLQAYHCPYPFSFAATCAEADILKHTWCKYTPILTQADTYFQLVMKHIMSQHIPWKDCDKYKLLYTMLYNKL